MTNSKTVPPLTEVRAKLAESREVLSAPESNDYELRKAANYLAMYGTSSDIKDGVETITLLDRKQLRVKSASNPVPWILGGAAVGFLLTLWALSEFFAF